MCPNVVADPYTLNHDGCIYALPMFSTRAQSQVCVELGRKDEEKTKNTTKIACKAKINAGGEACMEPAPPTHVTLELTK